MPLAGRERSWFADLLVCPLCHAELVGDATGWRCTACRADFPQSRPGRLDLLPRGFAERDATRWSDRQAEMEAWYLRPEAGEDVAARFERELRPFAGALGRISGRVLDLGGGVGAAGRRLGAPAEYVVADPSPLWWEPAFARLRDAWQPPAAGAVRAAGEWLPFRSASFDAVLALWSLNHVTDPARVLAEVARVLRPGGVFFVALEDVPFDRRFRDASALAAADPAEDESGVAPVASDHIALPLRRLALWTAPAFHLSWEAWIRQYLVLELRRRGASAVAPPVAAPRLVEVADVRMTGADALLRGAWLDFPKPGWSLLADEVELVGWAVGRGAAVERIEIVRPGDRVEAAPELPRPDVQRHFAGDPAALRSGFRMAARFAPDRADAGELVAVLRDGGRAPFARVETRPAEPATAPGD